MYRTLDRNKNFLGLDEGFSSFSRSRVVILPVPYERTASYGKGTKFGPEAILHASHFVEQFDEETKREIHRQFGIATLRPLDLAKKKDEAALQEIHNVVLDLIQRDKFVVTLGGEHTISSAAIAAYAKMIPDLSVLQIDAHADLRSEYLGSKYSHASTMARVCEFLDPKRLVQVGVRALCREEEEYIRDNGISTYYAHTIRNKYVGFLKFWMDDAIDRLTDDVYLSFDVDAFDPSVIPATGTPEPNGLFWMEVMEFLKKVGRKKKIVGADVVELAPVKGLHYAEVAAAKLVSKILNYAL